MGVRRLVGLAMGCVVFVLSPGQPFAAQVTNHLTVQLTIAPYCQILDIGALDFGAVEVTSTAVDRMANLLVRCSSGVSYKIKIDDGESADNGQRRLKHESGSDTLVYRVSQDAGHTQTWGADTTAAKTALGTGTEQAFQIYGRLEAPTANTSSLPRAGRYADRLRVTLEY
jgi:spore coat protein U-like protein